MMTIGDDGTDDENEEFIGFNNINKNNFKQNFQSNNEGESHKWLEWRNERIFKNNTLINHFWLFFLKLFLQ